MSMTPAHRRLGTSNPFISTLYGAVMGFLLSGGLR